MFILKGFVEITAFAENDPNQTSPLGEMSNQAESYSKEKGYYAKSGSEQLRLVTFTSTRDDSKIETPVEFHSHVLDIADWLFNNSVSGNITSDLEFFRTQLLANFETDIADVEIGKMVVANGNWMPSYIAWNYNTASEVNQIKIWFADESFLAQYDDYEIVVIPPIDVLDDFQKIKLDVEESLSGFSLPTHIEKVMTLAQSNPYTFHKSFEYDWYDREDPEATLMTNWSVIIYGINGNNPVVIKDAIADYILSLSSFSRTDWIAVFPDIFTSTEFTFVPMWHKRGIVDQTIAGSLYSPLVPYDESLILAEKYIQSSLAGHVQENLEISTLHFKSLAFVVAGGKDNRDAKFKLSDIFPDYALIAASSPDFNRMQPKTTQFITELQKAVIVAEEMDEYTYLDHTLARIERNGRDYIGFEYDDVLFLVLIRNHMDETQVEV